MRISVIGETAAAAMLLRAGAGAHEAAKRSAMESAGRIADEWQQTIPVGPAGRTGSEKENVAEDISSPGIAGAAAVSSFFVSTFLQFGTSKMSPKVDLLGSGQVEAEKWADALARDLL